MYALTITNVQDVVDSYYLFEEIIITLGPCQQEFDSWRAKQAKGGFTGSGGSSSVHHTTPWSRPDTSRGVTSGLMIRTFQEIRKVQPGFTSPEQVQVFSLAIPKSQVEQPERVIRMHNDILERLAAIPGVSAAGLTNSVPMDDAKNQNQISAENEPNEPGKSPPVRTFKFVSPGLLAATGTRLIAGRDLEWTDIHGRRSVVMVSENLARELWGSSSAALGKRIHEQGDRPQWREVVGVVEDVRDDGARKQPPKTVYWPFAIENFFGAPLNVQRNVSFAVRSPGAGTEAS